MHESLPNPYPPNAQAELARERNRIAADRSLLSFVRNSLTLISIGVGVNQVIRLLSPSDVTKPWVQGLSLGFIALGVLNLIWASQDYQGEMKRLQQPEYYFTPRLSLGGITGLVVVIASLGIFGWLLSKVFS
jgi:putative membrane protein